MTDPAINALHTWLWALLDALRSLWDIAPYVAVFTALSLVFTGLALAIRRQHDEQKENGNGDGNL
jgi:uncharacterized membrane protein YhaH (DUF805 family)